MTDRPRDPWWALALGVVTSRRVRLAVVAALFLGWMGWLGYAALSKNRGPVVSRAAAAAATHPVVAAVASDAEGRPVTKVEVKKNLLADRPAAGAVVEVVNLPAADGYTVDGEYLLLLAKDRGGDGYAVVGRQRSPGYDPSTAGRPVIYPWTPAVEAQARRLFPAGP
ncbi:MAG: hypothetical protein K2X87_21740 [Gemmataceae bacterium]|nr:hypothetical protein [Gemmataceae bacterium]